MKLKSLSCWSAVALLAVASACSKSSPTRPTTTDSATSAAAVTNAATGVTITAPLPAAPTNGQRFKFSDQPLTLTVKNAVTTGSGPLLYTFEVASDAAFTKVVYSKDGIAEGSGSTALKIDKLAGDKDYYWHARVTANGAPGPFSTARTFNVGPEVVLQAPIVISPADGATANGSNPTLTVANVVRTGPAGLLVYRFEVSDTTSFANPIFVATIQEQPNQTSASVTVQLTANAIYYWRAQASDPSNAVTGPFSAVSSFKYVPFDMHQAIILNSPTDLADWGQTAKITSVTFTGDAMVVDFDKRDGPDRWPDTPFGAGSLEYTLGMCLNINAQWYCSAVVQFWYGRELTASGTPRDVAREWFYDGARWGPMSGHQPEEGETVGFFVCAGNCRNNTAGDASYVKERSNVALVPFTYGYTSYQFLTNGQALRRRR